MKKYFGRGAVILLGLGVGFASTAIAYTSPFLKLDISQSQYLSISDASQIGLDITGDMTAECWVNLNSLVDNQTAAILSKDDVEPNRGYNFGIIRQGNNYFGAMEGSLDGTNSNTNRFPIQMQGFGLNEWHHVAFAYTANKGKVELYLDGIKQGETLFQYHSIHDTSAEFAIGQYADSVFFDGQLDNCRVWDKKRSAQSILNKMNELVVPDADGLVGQWSFRRNFKDTSENGNDLTSVNGATLQN